MKYLAFILSGGLCLSACQESPSAPAATSTDTTAQVAPQAQTVAHISEDIPTDTTLTFSIDDLMGKIDPANDARFVALNTPFANRKMYLRTEAAEQFKKMHAAAKKEGIHLQVISATRPFKHQKSIWEAKWTGKRKVDGKLLSPTVKDPKTRAEKILRWSSMPGTSRHHWGTDIDINQLTNEYFEAGKGLKEYQWLTKNAATFGFCQVYSKMDATRPHGYQEEKWHWSYLPIASAMTQQYKAKIKNADISGFKGADAAPAIDIVGKYVLGINPSCH